MEVKSEEDEVWNFVSVPYLHPMKIKVNVDKCKTAAGYIFVAPYTAFGENMVGQTGALIIEESGMPVWFRPLENRYIQNTDFRVQEYKGEPVLTAWQGTISGTQSDDSNLPAGDPEPGAFFLIFNNHYQIIKVITAKKGYTADVHEFSITVRNTALFTAIKQVPMDLSKYGGPEKGYIDNYSIQEVDIESGDHKLLFLWNALKHVDPEDSMISASSATSSNNIWDCYHVNSVSEGPDDTLLISMRNMWAIYDISKSTGDVLWQVGGKRSNFEIETSARFSWQHDARWLEGNRISMFDDACCASSTAPAQGQGRGLIVHLDFEKMTVSKDRTYYHAPPLIVPSQGNVQKLENRNRFIGWGQEPYISEFAPKGNNKKNPKKNLLYDAQFPGGNLSYRAFKNLWRGTPFYPPDIVAITSGSTQNPQETRVYVSWNGSTETEFWRLFAGKSENALAVVSEAESVPRTSFETIIKVKTDGPYFQVQALNEVGEVIGTSQVVTVR